MKNRLFSLIVFSMLVSAPAFAMRESEGPQFSRRWIVAKSDNPERGLSSNESKEVKEEETSVNETEKNTVRDEATVPRKPVFHHVGRGDR